MNLQRVEALIQELLIEMGEDISRKGLKRTPTRFAKALEFLTSGYTEDFKTIINETYFPHNSGLVINKNIAIYSLCEHHLLPFFGICHIGYIPKHQVIGLSKLTRISQTYARRLQVQERLTEQIAKTLMEEINAIGVGVMLNCRHLCNEMRGVEQNQSVMITCSTVGNLGLSEKEFIHFITSLE
ncbi:GTP cyclohydrolase I [Legionella lansingensis]|uniref:GTP cyclohydrolase 1 n=1 Tax=Legionella lansingensis TaxID=45067 RepID=A0A0W0VIW6_9GAMM|nr:GTP cyclohydrolase I FolE [Legionella lansingensis]KTD20048.1 GTP cyclohydrolase I [Legionella lansingensis]SNV50968.1 GTP cyclohydrolase I [Legionella lansingensis]